MKKILQSYFSTILFISLWYLFYTNNSYYNNYLFKDLTFLDFSINTIDVFNIIFLLYIILLIPFYILEKEESKALSVIKALSNKIKDSKYKIKKQEKTNILAWLVKLFFVPLMISWISKTFFIVLNKIYYWFNNTDLILDSAIYFINNYLFLTLLPVIILIDLLYFTIWYLLESKYLNNKIKSVEPTLFWWVIALICYPPFSNSINDILWWYSTNFPEFNNIIAHITINILFIIFFILYTSASVSLWFKASNLTNRGIVSKWLYKYVRHPAYICKNIWRTIWITPILIASIISFNIKTTILILISTIWWWLVYYYRAMTEEKHLEKDIEYRKYKEKVKYKFIPKIW